MVERKFVGDTLEASYSENTGKRFGILYKELDIIGTARRFDMNFYDRALELKDELVENRRYFHKNAEVGLHMPMAKA